MRIARDTSNGMARIIANLGCDICPKCGETRDYFDYAAEGIPDKGLSGPGTYRLETTRRIFFVRLMRVDCYSCYTCGCEWESDPYPV